MPCSSSVLRYRTKYLRTKLTSDQSFRKFVSLSHPLGRCIGPSPRTSLKILYEWICSSPKELWNRPIHYCEMQYSCRVASIALLVSILENVWSFMTIEGNIFSYSQIRIHYGETRERKDFTEKSSFTSTFKRNRIPALLISD